MSTHKQIIALAYGFNVYDRPKWAKVGMGIQHEFKSYSPSANLGLAAECIKRIEAAGGKVTVQACIMGKPHPEIPASALLDAYEPEFAEMRAVERTSKEELDRRETRAKIAEKASRRLIAPEIDTTGDFLDARAAANPLLAWCQ